MTKNKKPDYNIDVQRVYLEMFLGNSDMYARCANIFEPENFDQRLREAATFIKEYADKHRAVPPSQIVTAATRTPLESAVLPADSYEWLMEEFEQFSRHKGLERAILASAELLESGDYNPVEKMIRDAVQISLNRDMGTNYWEDPRTRLEKLRSANGQVSTGWSTVDFKLYGGLSRGELNIFCAGSSGGKSLFLANLGVNWALMGMNVLYLTFELAEELVAKRIDSMVTGIASKEIFAELDNVEMKVHMVGKKAGGMQIKYMPSGKTVNDIRAYLKEYHIRKGHDPDVILIDYLDLLMPISIKISPENLFIKDKYVSEELRNLAMEAKAVCVTASQFNRGAVDETEFDHSHISGGLSKIQTADNVIAIYASRDMKDRGCYQLQFLKTRNSAGVGQKIDLEYNAETLRITDPGVDAQPAMKENILDAVRRTSKIDMRTGEITESPVEPIEQAAPKVKAKTASGIRDLLRALDK